MRACPYRKLNPALLASESLYAPVLMIGWLHLLLNGIAVRFKSRARLEAEVLILRHQVNVLRRSAGRRPRLTAWDRLVFVALYRLCPQVLDAVAIVNPDTVIRWHRRGFRAFWRWKSRSGGGRPAIPNEIRDLIREMSGTNWLWGAPRIHGELLKLGIEVAQSTVAKYMVKRRGPPSQTWRTFLRNHADGVAAADLFVVPTIGFKLLYCLVILAHGRRKLIHHAVRHTLRPSGLPGRWSRRFRGIQHHDICCEIATPSMATL